MNDLREEHKRKLELKSQIIESTKSDDQYEEIKEPSEISVHQLASEIDFDEDEAKYGNLARFIEEKKRQRIRAERLRMKREKNLLEETFMANLPMLNIITDQGVDKKRHVRSPKTTRPLSPSSPEEKKNGLTKV